MRRFYIFLSLMASTASLQAQPDENSTVPRLPQVEFGQTGLDLSLNKVRLLHHLLPQLDGSPLVLSIKEDAFDTADIDFKGRLLPTEFASPEVQIHASAMATIAAGAGNSDPTGRGVARGAQLSSSDFANLMPDEDAWFLSQNISVQNHSYGTGIENFYGIEARAYDEQCRRLPSLLHVFSAGNQGEQASQSGNYAGIGGFANLTGQFKQSKNTLTVGACDSLGQVVPLSSRGPAFDGRIKPELVAYGHGGSSGAAALVSGIALLVQQAFLEKNQGEMPPSELVRAVLVNSADDVGRPQVDFETGFGNADALAAVQTVLEDNFYLGEISQGETKEIGLSFPSQFGVGVLKITLAWNDSPAAENAGTALVNDLDLEVRSDFWSEPTLPWVLATSPHPDSLLRDARRGRDSLNNVEQVSFFFVVTDVPLLVEVKGRKISGGGQTFAVAWQFDTLNPVRWFFPSGSDYLLPNRQNLLRWESLWNPGMGKLDVRFPPENDWQTIENQVNLSTGSFAWGTPDRTGLAQLRFTAGASTWLSDTFTIAEPLRPKVGFDCPDSLLFFWQPTPGATDYQIFKLGDRYLEPLALTSDTQFVADAATKAATTHFAVAPRFEGKTGALSYAFDYAKQGVGCYLRSFYLQHVLGSTATFAAEIGTTHGLAAVIFEKEMSGEFVPVQEISPVESLSLAFEDASLRQGVNRYRLRLLLENGGEVLSRVEEAHFLESASYLVFPNPAAPGEPVFLLSKEPGEARVRLLDAQGKLVFQGAATEQVVTLPNLDLASGLYFIEVLDGGKRWAGKLFVSK